MKAIRYVAVSLLALSMVACATLSKDDRATLAAASQAAGAAQHDAAAANATANQALQTAQAADAKAQSASQAASAAAANAAASADAAKAADQKADRMFQKSLRK